MKTLTQETQMKKVTRNNLLLFIDWKKQYSSSEKKDIVLLKKINNFVNNVINKDSKYFRKLYDYDFTNEELKHLLF